MIRLGFLHKKHDDTYPYNGNAFFPPHEGPNGDLNTVDEDLANEQFKDIQKYLLHVGRFFAWSLSNARYPGSNPRRQEKYANSESSSISIVKSGGNGSSNIEYHLRVDIKSARKRRKAKMSWIFERLYVLSKAPLPMDVWYSPGSNLEAAQTGSRFDSGDLYKGVEPMTGAKLTKLWIITRNKYRTYKLSQELRGLNYFHELVIHAWRDLEFGYVPIEKPKWWSDEKYFIQRSGHMHKGHITGLDSGKHNLADIEADFLNFYLFFNQDWVDDARKSSAFHDSREAVGMISRNIRPRLDLMGEKWFTYAGLKRRMAEGRRK